MSVVDPAPAVSSLDGIARREELTDLSYDAIEAQIDARRWRRLNEVVIVLHNGPLSPEQQLLAVWLSAAAPAALCAWTAASRLGLRGHEPDAVHVLIERGARVLPTPGIRRCVHESRRFTAADVRHPGRPAYVSVERGVVDAAVWSRKPQDAARLFAAAVQQRLTTPSALLQELDGAGKVRHRELLRRLLVDLHGGAQALSEVALLRFCDRHNLPRPELNVRCDATGRRRYLDAVFRTRDGRIVRA